MVREAVQGDAEQLRLLNEEFNGPYLRDAEQIAVSLRENRQERVIVDEEDGILVGFVCVQIKRSFCYETPSAELAEVYVRPAYRRRGIAGAMIAFAERLCRERDAVRSFELLTGRDNLIAQSVYRRLGYGEDGEIHLSKG